MKVLLDLEKCIGCGSCESVCSNFFKLGDDMKVHLENAEKEGSLEKKEVEDIGCLKEAADICPVQAIKIEE